MKLTSERVCDLAAQTNDLGAFRQEVLRSLVADAGCAAGLYQDSGPTVAVDSQCVHQLPTAVLHQVQGNWRRYADGLAPVLTALPHERIVVDSAVMPIDRTDFYAEVMRPNGWDSTLYAHVQMHPTHPPVIIALVRERSDRPFNDGVTTLVKRILPTLVLADAALQSTRRAVMMTDDERVLAQFVSNGLTNKEIGVLLGLSEFTIRNRLMRMFDKYEMSTRAELAYRFGKDLL